MKNFNVKKAYSIAEQIALLSRANEPLERVFQGTDNPNVRAIIDESQGRNDEALTELAVDLYYATGAAYREGKYINAEVYQTLDSGYRTLQCARNSLEDLQACGGLDDETAEKIRAAYRALTATVVLFNTVLDICEKGD